MSMIFRPFFREPRLPSLYSTTHLPLIAISISRKMISKVSTACLATSPADPQPLIRLHRCLLCQALLFQQAQVSKPPLTPPCSHRSLRSRLMVQSSSNANAALAKGHSLRGGNSSKSEDTSQDNSIIRLIVLFSKHINSHERPYKCSAETCHHRGTTQRYRAATQRDLDRHHASAHNIHPPGQHRYVYHCSYASCIWGPNGTSNGFARKDRAKRHVDNQHRGQGATVIQTRIQ